MREERGRRNEESREAILLCISKWKTKRPYILTYVGEEGKIKKRKYKRKENKIANKITVCFYTFSYLLSDGGFSNDSSFVCGPSVMAFTYEF